MKKDIETRNDIILLVDSFYGALKMNEKLNYIFSDVAQIDWDKHLPKMYSFWASLILGEHSYTGDPMFTHMALSKQTPMGEIEFTEWLLLFNNTVDKLFNGNNADEAKTRAANIARLMLFKINNK